MHDKYLIADDTAYILGGRNSNNLFLGAYRDTYNIDRDLYVLERTEKNASDVMQKKERNSLQDIKAYFEKIWVQPDQKYSAKRKRKRPKKGLRCCGSIIRNCRLHIRKLFQKPKRF